MSIVPHSPSHRGEIAELFIRDGSVYDVECQNSCLNAFRVMERHAPLPLPSDLEKIVSGA